ncbi:MAG: ParB N-terminal domain-containing protein [Rhodobacteraceae bacterium]|nr:ParB N-terminal domain-containing protein [Paracoccaceae bacterium]
MTSKNKFGFEPLETKGLNRGRQRSVGPMGAAVREAAESLQEATDAKVEQRRLNASDAKEYRAAQQEGRVLVSLPLERILTDDLPRDRLDLEAVAVSDEMDELVSSIRARGQREPIEVFRDASGDYQLKKGWRRLTALRRLFAETDDPAFAKVVARVAVSDENRIALYVDMVEENVVREDLSFAEMAQLAITAAEDTALGEGGAEALVGKLYGSLHKMKRSYIRSFVFLLQEMGGAVRWPKMVSRNLGADVSRRLKSSPELADSLRLELGRCETPEDQTALLSLFVSGKSATERPAGGVRKAREKFEFHIGEIKVTARNGECRIVGKTDYSEVSRERLEKAVRAFQRALEDEGNPRVTQL